MQSVFNENHSCRERRDQKLRGVRRQVVFGIVLFFAYPIFTKADPDPSGVHIVLPGESLFRLSHKYGVSIRDLAAANHLSTTSRLKRGMRLNIPSIGKKQTGESAADAHRDNEASPQQTIIHERRISINFSEVEVRQALSTISDYAKTDILVTPGSTGMISVSLRNRTVDDAIRLTASAAGLSVANTGGAYIVGKAEQVSKVVGDFGQSEMAPLRTATVQEARELLARVAPLVTVEAAGNGVLISGLPKDIITARMALRDLDANRPAIPAPKQETEIASLHFIEPAMAQRVLHDAFPSIRIARQEKILIITATPETLTAADSALKLIDVEPVAAPNIPEALVYRLKYLNAITAETSLKKLYTSLKIAVAPEPTSPPPATFQPLSTNTLNSGSGSQSGGSGGSSLGGSGGGVSGGQSSAGGLGGSSVANQTLSRSVRLILIGPSEDVKQAKYLLDQTDVAPPLVRIEASLVEVNRDNLKNLGMAWDFTNSKFTFSVPGGTGLDFTKNLQRDSATTAANFSVQINALITQNRARILANPNISVVDNEDANIFIGDLLRFPGATTTTQTATVQSIDTIPIGIALLVRPRIHPNGEVTLKVHPVVSSISGFNTVNGQSQPQTASREADTTVRLRAGQELVIGGLSRKELTSNLQKVPFLSDLPFIGQFFQSRNTGSKETEILIFIRAYPVLTQPAPVDQTSILPRDTPPRTDKSSPKQGTE